MFKSAFSQILIDWASALNTRAARLTFQTDDLTPYASHRPIFPYDSSKPLLAPQVHFTHTSQLLGAVELETNVIIGHHTCLNADNAPIRIGQDTVIGDHVVMDTRDYLKSMPGSVNIGCNVYVGDKAVLISCVIDDGVYIGESSFIPEGVVIERGVTVLPCSTVQPNVVLESGKTYGGNPAMEITNTNQQVSTIREERIASRRSQVENLKEGDLFIKTE